MTGPQLKATVEQLFTIIRDRSTEEELVFLCPVPGCGDESGNRSVSLRTGKTNCWRCNKGGDFVKWAKFLGYMVEDSRAVASRALDEVDIKPWTPGKTARPVVKDIPLPTGFRLCSDYPKSVYTKLIAEMAERKNLGITDFYEAGVGFAKDDLKWEPYAIFPVKEYARTVYFQGRTYCDTPGESTKRFPDRKEAPYSAKYWIYGIDELRRDKTPLVMVMESILNVLSVRRFMREHCLKGVTPVCVFKHYLSTPQALKLVELPYVREVCLLYDHDATRSAWQKAPRISDRIRISVAQMPPGPGGAKNDPNDDVVSAWKAFEKRQHADQLSSILAEGIGHVDIVKVAQREVPLLNPLDRLHILSGSSLHDTQDSKAVRRPSRTPIG